MRSLVRATTTAMILIAFAVPTASAQAAPAQPKPSGEAINADGGGNRYGHVGPSVKEDPRCGPNERLEPNVWNPGGPPVCIPAGVLQ
ncbi:hypothetical protein GCM10010289_85160 [Streptomyces violascens]|nr:hypothetical protein GCM10010289_85160 [Streptomyces violascens]